MIRFRSTAAYRPHLTLSWTVRYYRQRVVTHSASRASLDLLGLAHGRCCWRDHSDPAVGSAADAVYGAGFDSIQVGPVAHRRMHCMGCLNRGLACVFRCLRAQDVWWILGYTRRRDSWTSQGAQRPQRHSIWLYSDAVPTRVRWSPLWSAAFVVLVCASCRRRIYNILAHTDSAVVFCT
jgi:hypothetical protein